MFEKEIKHIADYSLNQLRSYGSSITFEKLSASDVHPAVKKYISAELDYLINEDRKKLLSSQVFDYSSPEISKHLAAISAEIKRNSKISLDDIRKLILQAVSFNVNFIVKPKWALSKFIFNEADEKPAEEIKKALNYLYYYTYFRKIISAYIDKKNAHSITLIEFEVLLNKIDKELFSNGGREVLDDAINTIVSFFSTGSVPKNKIEVHAVEFYLREKNLDDYLLRLRNAFPVEPSGTCSVEELKAILYYGGEPDYKSPGEPEAETKIADTTDAFEEAPAEEDEGFEEIFEEEIIKGEEALPVEENEAAVNDFGKNNAAIEEDITADDDELLSYFDKELEALDKKEDTGGQLFIDEEVNPAEKALEEMYDFTEDEDIQPAADKPELIQPMAPGDELFPLEETLDEDVENELLTSDEFEVTSEADDIPAGSGERIDYLQEQAEEEIQNSFEDAPAPRRKLAKDIFSFLTNKEIERIVQNVFNDDQEDFANTMERITECDVYEEATEILKGVFLSYRINPYSRDAVVLTNAVALYFNQA